MLPPTDRFDDLIRLLGASASEQGELATIRDRIEESRRVDAAVVRPSTPVARELPPDVSAFTGRVDRLAALDRLLAGGADDAVLISVVSGTAGAGKTALAVHWAHRVAQRFPDGQLFADLRGYDSDEPVDPVDVLAGFLRRLGLEGRAVPADPAEREARYRTLLAGRRVLVVLDNARTAQQVRPLLPGSGSSLVLVTSRDDLAGLVARDGAHRVAVDPFTPDEARTLLRDLVGARVDDEPGAADVLAERCGHLPLALRLVAELAAARPDASLTDLVADLNVERQRLTLLDAGGDPRAIRTIFSWSIRNLTAGAARAFALLGRHPGHDFDRHALAALTATPVDEAARLVDELARANVIGATRPRRYAMHDLMRVYAAERAGVDLEPDAARAAQDRLFDHYVAAAAAAAEALYPVGRDRTEDPLPARTTVGFDGPDAAQRWFDDEHANLVALAGHAADHGWPRHSVELSRSLWNYLDGYAYYQDAAVVHGAAERAGRYDRRGRGEVLRALAVTCYRLGRLDDAIAHLREALAGYRASGDRYGEARVLNYLGAICGGVGRYREAVGYLEAALGLFRVLKDGYQEGLALGNLGDVCLRLGRYAEAAEYLTRGLAIQRGSSERLRGCYVLASLGVLRGRTGHPGEGVELLSEALDISREFHDRRGESEILTEIAVLYRQTDRHPDALEQLRRAHDIAREIGEPLLEMAARNGLGDTHRALGQARVGLAHHRSALDLARRIGDRYQLARALDGIGHALHDAGRTGAARRHWRGALSIFTEMGVPEAEPVRARLDP